jgi:hypothetical protein
LQWCDAAIDCQSNKILALRGKWTVNEEMFYAFLSLITA